MNSLPQKFVYRIESTAKLLEPIINQRLNAFFIGLPKSGIKRTISEAFKFLGYLDELSIIDISLLDPATITNFLDIKFSQNNNLRPTFFLIENLTSLSSDWLKTFDIIEKTRHQHRKNTNLIYHFNINPFWYGVPESSRQLIYFPLATKFDYADLIKHYSLRFGKNISSAESLQTFKLTGGHPYLVKKIFEQNLIGQTTKAIIDKLQPVATSILDTLPLTEVIRLKNFTSQSNDFQQHYFNIGLFDKNSRINNSSIFAKSLSSFVSTQKLSINSQNNTIQLGNVNISNYFAPHEIKLLVYLSTTDSINRDQLISICWGNHQSIITDSAIDKLVSRLRQKIADLGLPSDLIITSRGRGYSLNNDKYSR